MRTAIPQRARPLRSQRARRSGDVSRFLSRRGARHRPRAKSLLARGRRRRADRTRLPAGARAMTRHSRWRRSRSRTCGLRESTASSPRRARATVPLSIAPTTPSSPVVTAGGYVSPCGAPAVDAPSYVPSRASPPSTSPGGRRPSRRPARHRRARTSGKRPRRVAAQGSPMGAETPIQPTTAATMRTRAVRRMLRAATARRGGEGRRGD